MRRAERVVRTRHVCACRVRLVQVLAMEPKEVPPPCPPSDQGVKDIKSGHEQEMSAMADGSRANERSGRNGRSGEVSDSDNSDGDDDLVNKPPPPPPGKVEGGFTC